MLLQLQRKPVLWNLGNQMTGDTIHLISNVKTEKLDSLKVFNNAFLVSKDTLSEDGYNQVKGQRANWLISETMNCIMLISSKMLKSFIILEMLRTNRLVSINQNLAILIFKYQKILLMKLG